jgi:hypothetical protein
VEEREEAKRRILKENPHVAKDELEFVLSLPVERKIPKVTELETILFDVVILKIDQRNFEKHVAYIKKTAYDFTNNIRLEDLESISV